MNEEKRNSKNSFELEGNIANIGEIYTNKNGKKSLRFDLGQNNNDKSEFIPIIIKGNLVDSYAEEIQKGNWITVKGKITSYLKDVEKDGISYKEKTTDIIGFEIIDRTNNKKYSFDGNVQELNDNKEMER